MYGYAIPLLCECYMGHGLHLTEVGNPYIPHHDLQLSPRHAQLLRCFTLLLGTKSLNHAPQQWHSDPRRMIHVRICYLTVLLISHEARTTSDRGGKPHTSPQDLQLHPRHDHLLHRFLEPRALTLHHSGDIVV